jgi:hypothetical protein
VEPPSTTFIRPCSSQPSPKANALATLNGGRPYNVYIIRTIMSTCFDRNLRPSLPRKMSKEEETSWQNHQAISLNWSTITKSSTSTVRPSTDSEVIPVEPLRYTVRNCIHLLHVQIDHSKSGFSSIVSILSSISICATATRRKPRVSRISKADLSRL